MEKRKKIEKGKKEKVALKNGLKCLKSSPFWVINFAPDAESKYAGE